MKRNWRRKWNIPKLFRAGALSPIQLPPKFFRNDKSILMSVYQVPQGHSKSFSHLPKRRRNKSRMEKVSKLISKQLLDEKKDEENSLYESSKDSMKSASQISLVGITHIFRRTISHIKGSGQDRSRECAPRSTNTSTKNDFKKNEPEITFPKALKNNKAISIHSKQGIGTNTSFHSPKKLQFRETYSSIRKETITNRTQKSKQNLKIILKMKKLKSRIGVCQYKLLRTLSFNAKMELAFVEKENITPIITEAFEKFKSDTVYYKEIKLYGTKIKIKKQRFKTDNKPTKLFMNKVRTKIKELEELQALDKGKPQGQQKSAKNRYITHQSTQFLDNSTISRHYTGVHEVSGILCCIYAQIKSSKIYVTVNPSYGPEKCFNTSFYPIIKDIDSINLQFEVNRLFFIKNDKKLALRYYNNYSGCMPQKRSESVINICKLDTLNHSQFQKLEDKKSPCKNQNSLKYQTGQQPQETHDMPLQRKDLVIEKQPDQSKQKKHLFYTTEFL
ncbi:unnamed protein product [Moneuplotes crassus]|uniref:Uncharacterized protein n=1 Tax=Euplotes crassus TaxID=5936 RepID=A0AAD1U3Z5_EUPCR|nr:unnamed protein product [Moneuplotes crassus]